jgi:uncharacterized protein
MQKTLAQQNAQRGRTLRLLRKIHGWLGLWGAVLGLLFGVTGFLLNHRAVMKIPAAHMEESEIQLSVPQPYPQDAKAFTAFVQQALDIRHDPLERKPRKGGKAGKDKAGEVKAADSTTKDNGAAEPRMKEKPGHDARFLGQEMAQPAKWEVEFRMPQMRIRAEYIAGNQFATIYREDANAWAYIMNMHKGVGANTAWVLLADTIAGALIVLSITGVLLWTKMRQSRLVMAGLISTSLVATVWAALSML